MNGESEKSRQAIAALHENLKKVKAPSVLIVDDDRNDIMALQRQIAMDWPHVRTQACTNAALALDAARSGRFDLVLLDLKLAHAGLSGVEIFKELRATGPDVPVIGWTGLETDSELWKEAMRAGMDVICRKPMSRESLELVFGKL